MNGMNGWASAEFHFDLVLPLSVSGAYWELTGAKWEVTAVRAALPVPAWSCSQPWWTFPRCPGTKFDNFGDHFDRLRQLAAPWCPWVSVSTPWVSSTWCPGKAPHTRHLWCHRRKNMPYWPRYSSEVMTTIRTYITDNMIQHVLKNMYKYHAIWTTDKVNTSKTLKVVQGFCWQRSFRLFWFVFGFPVFWWGRRASIRCPGRCLPLVEKKTFATPPTSLLQWRPRSAEDHVAVITVTPWKAKLASWEVERNLKIALKCWTFCVPCIGQSEENNNEIRNHLFPCHVKPK